MNDRIALEPFFLDSDPGRRFCLYHGPARGAPRGAVLYAPPFAEEMNKARRMAAVQARALAANGVAVLLMDPFGCGDSSGEFVDARWAIWLADMAVAWNWLRHRTGCAPWLWGLRLGANLALEFARSAAAAAPAAGFLLWQPVVNGEAYMTQFLRLKLAAEMLQAGAPRTGTREMRAALAQGEMLEVAGYAMNHDLVQAIDGLRLAELPVPTAPIRWFEMVAQPDRPAPPAAAQVLERWRAAGCDARIATIAGEAFWSSGEIVQSPALIAASTPAIVEFLARPAAPPAP